MSVALTFNDSLNGGFDSFFRALPQILGALVLLVIGWVVAGLVGRLVKRLANRLGADRLTKRAGIDGFLQKAGVHNASAGSIFGFIVKWWIRLIVLEVAIPALGIAAITATLDRIVAYIPSVFAALLILIVGAFLAKLAGEAVRGIAQGAGFANAATLASVVQGIVLVLVLIAALQQVHIAETLINELLIAVPAGAALAAGLAFGLGGRDVAARMLGSAYQKGREASAQLQGAVQPGNASRSATGAVGGSPGMGGEAGARTQPGRDHR